MLDTTLASDGPSLAGSIVGGKYRVLRIIGSGGMGTVWEGSHVALGTRVAIKFIKPRFAEQAEARARFEIEARAAAKLKTKHAVHVFDYGVSGEGLPYIVMEFLEGESLSDAIISRGPLGDAEVAKIITQAARALSRAHAAGIVHRDLKPDNIFLATAEEPVEGLPYVVKLVDFGIAKMFDDEITSTGSSSPMGGPTREGTVIGTPNFMAPEQLTVGGAPGPLTDLWSLGACTFAAMTGRLPFEGDVLGDIVLKVCAAPMPAPSKINPGVPNGFDAWFGRACSRDPTRRFQTADELAQALAGVCGLGRIRMATLDEDQIQYVMRPKADADDLDSLPPPAAMSPRTALLAGLVLGIAMMVGLLGFFAWHERNAAQAPVPVAPASP
jgi:serine/threonine-protein kinase